MYYNIMFACVAVAMLLLPFCHANAQEPMTAQDSVKQMRQLRDDVKKKQKFIETLKAKIQNADEDSVKIVASEAYLTAQLLMRKIDSLREDTAKVAAAARAAVDEARRNCEASGATAAASYSADSLRLVQLRKERDELVSMRDNMERNLIEAVGKEWQKKLFSQMTVPELEAECKKYEEYKTNQSVAVAAAQMQTLLQQQRVYQQALDALNSKYNASAVSQLTSKVRQLEASITHAGKRDELKKVEGQLSSYPGAVEKFKAFIGKVDVLKSVGQAGLPKLLESIQRKDRDSLAVIKTIPWLSEQYEEYCKRMIKDFKTAEEIEETIKGL